MACLGIKTVEKTGNSAGNSGLRLRVPGNSAHRKGNSASRYLLPAVTCAVTAKKPGKAAKGSSVTARKETSLNLRIKENNQYLSIRAREAVTACHFLPLEPCVGCGYGKGIDTCALVDEVPSLADPREWYIDWLEHSIASLGAAS